ncbi:MAG: hypothetical protein H0T62_00835 [Parachlamydiaceae bacterium]|nr:hypothetical protein [Parachlamydiaceae bacterium]
MIRLNILLKNCLFCITEKQIQSLESHQVIVFLNEGMFLPSTAKYISPAHIKEIDFTKVDCKKAGGKIVISAIFQGNDKKIQFVEILKSLPHILPFIESIMFVDLRDDQLQSIDFKNEDIINSQVIFGLTNQQGIARLTSQQVIDGLNRKLFNFYSATEISPAQIKEIDFTKVDCKKAGGKDVISAIFKGNDKKIQLVETVKSLPHILPFINPFMFVDLRDEQLQSIDFKDKDIINYQVISALANQQNVDRLTSQQVIDGLNRNLFNFHSATVISPAQIKEIDFTKVDCKKAGGKDVISAIFKGNDKKIQLVKTVKSLPHILPFIDPFMFVDLRDDQLQSIDFKDKDIINHQVISALANQQNVARLTSQQIMDGLNRTLFNFHSATTISSAQIENIDFTKVDCKKAGGKDVISAIFKGNDKKIQLVETVKSLPHILPFIESYMFVDLRDDQLQSIDFSDEDIINYQVISALANQQGIARLTSQQIMDGLNRTLFNFHSATGISPAQIEKIDFTQVDCKKAGGKDVISAIFKGNNKKIQLVETLKSLPHILPFIESHMFVDLKDDQLQSIDFKNEDIINLQVIYSLANKEDIGRLTSQQVVDGLNRKLFDHNTIQYVEDKVIIQLDLEFLENIKPRTPIVEKVIARKNKLVTI